MGGGMNALECRFLRTQSVSVPWVCTGRSNWWAVAEPLGVMGVLSMPIWQWQLDRVTGAPKPHLPPSPRIGHPETGPAQALRNCPTSLGCWDHPQPGRVTQRPPQTPP